MLIVEHVAKEYPTPAGTLPVLRDVSLTVNPGQSVAIVGPSGSGKSTLLNILGALDCPTAGRVTLDGHDYAGMSETDLSQFRNRQIGFLFQEHHLLPQCTVLENVLVPILACRRATTADLHRAQDLLTRVGLADRANHFPGELSGGERQRAALARALIMQPRMILADEPTGNLDVDTARQVINLLLEQHRQNGNILIVVTHSWLVARRMEEVLRLRNGTVEPLNLAAKEELLERI